MSRLQPTEAAILYEAFQGNENQFRTMLKRFEPIIRGAVAKAARRIGTTRREDLQDLELAGQEALWRAARGFLPGEDPTKFLGYAIKAIDNALIDVVRKELRYKENISIGLPGIDYLSTYTSDSSPCYTSSYSYEAGDRASPFDWTITTTLPIRTVYLLDYEGYKRIGLTDRDIQMWGFYLFGYKMWEIAEKFHLSSTYVSRLLGKIRAKIYNEHK